nr:terminase family protein [Moritella viscosa]SHO06838.1 Putative uncharacterized protein [Moritella viscosa]
MKKGKNDIAHLTIESFEQWHVLVSACKYSKKVYDNRHCRTRNILKPSDVDVLSYFTAEALEDAILTGRNQLFLSSSLTDSDVICNSIITFSNDFLGVNLTGNPVILSNGAELRFLSIDNKTMGAFSGNVYINNYFKFPHFTEMNKIVSAWSALRCYRKVYFSTKLKNEQAELFWLGGAQTKLPAMSEVDLGTMCLDRQWRLSIKT